ncbi:pilus assembly protein [Brachybacterium huguangmaarense]|uniref:Pilus assembly protein n=1 Tax=Brachybacterium huguangmaarense TaxID=1652028 RepID=A0ABY6FY02_9MICO|nr:TadE/TadG family type IV pilus assembly protein [Brachybacterium huguangmaarense]UYG15809.1 pilus assembly protein [Brachybacterium huguangmaarense]
MAARRLRSERGSAVVEFPLIAVLILLIALAIIQAALIMYARNALTDAAVQGAHHASLVGNSPADGAARTRQLVDERFGSAYDVTATAREDETGRITVEVTAAIPLVGLLGPSGTLVVDGHAVDEEAT